MVLCRKGRAGARGNVRGLHGHSPGGARLKKGQHRLLQAHAATIRQAVKRGVLAGVASTAFYKGRAVYRQSFGHADLETGTRFRHDTICRIYCSTKPYISLLTMIFVEKGILSLEDPAWKYVPSLEHLTVQRAVGEGPSSGTLTQPAPPTVGAPTSASADILIRHLLTHTAGFGYGIDFNFPPDESQMRYSHLVEAVERGRVRSLAEFVDMLAGVPLLFEPGDRYEYSYCYDVLGRVLEVAGSGSLDRLLSTHIFDRLGMSDTGFGVPEGKSARLAAIYGNATTWGHLNLDSADAVPIVTKPGLVRIDGSLPLDSAWMQDRVQVLSGGGLLGHNRGGLVSTARDTELLVSMLLGGGLCSDGTRLVTPRTLRAMERNLLVGPMRTGDKARWCLLGDMPERSGVFQQGGAAGNYWMVDRNRKIAVVVFMQQVDGEKWEDIGFESKLADIDQVMKVVAAIGEEEDSA